jgi:DNA-binding NtrC family response regulator
LSTARRRILVVSDTLTLANNLLMWLREAGYDPAVVTSFNAGKEHLRTAPDILITELKLREYNGLHLALRAHRDGIPAAVIGADPRYAADAQEIGARYLAGDNVHRDDILLLIDGLLSARAVPPATVRLEWAVNATGERAPLAAETPWPEDSCVGSDDLESASRGRPVVH